MMYSAGSKGPFKVSGFHDPDDKRIVSILYKPAVWVTGTVYYKWSDSESDVVLPTVFKGLYFKVTNPGLSGATEPVWPTTVGQTVTDGGIVWEAVAYNLLKPTVSILTSTFVASDSVTLTSPTNTAGLTQVIIGAVPSGVTTFTITNHTVKDTGEEEDVTLQFKVAER